MAKNLYELDRWGKIDVMDEGFNLNRLRDAKAVACPNPSNAPDIGVFIVTAVMVTIGTEDLGVQTATDIATGIEYYRARKGEKYTEWNVRGAGKVEKVTRVGPSALEAMEDVLIEDPKEGDRLTFKKNKWVSEALPEPEPPPPFPSIPTLDEYLAHVPAFPEFPIKREEFDDVRKRLDALEIPEIGADFNLYKGLGAGAGIKDGSCNTIIGSQKAPLPPETSGIVMLSDGSGVLRFYANGAEGHFAVKDGKPFFVDADGVEHIVRLD